jgi:hypothetical protein
MVFHCSGCGVQIEGGTAGCRALFDGLALRRFSELAYAQLQFKMVDTYAVQHPDEFCSSAKSLAAHLCGLCIAQEQRNGLTARRARKHGSASIQESRSRLCQSRVENDDHGRRTARNRERSFTSSGFLGTGLDSASVRNACTKLNAKDLVCFIQFTCKPCALTLPIASCTMN